MNRKNLTAAVLAGLAGAAGIVGSAQAVNINPDGLGQVLVYPYYTTNGGNNTILSVVNTSENAKAVKVRFLEGQNSQEVLDFNLYMSPYDVWTAALFVNEDGLPSLATSDTSCTVPKITEETFKPWELDDGGSTDVSRGAEGHFEMIEMGTLTDESEGTATAVTHVNGVPPNCAKLVNAWTDYDDPDDQVEKGYWFSVNPLIDIDPPSGGLFGGAAIVNVNKGTMYSYDAVAINGFSESGLSADFDPLHTNPGTIRPNLSSNDRLDGTVFLDNGNTYSAQFDWPVDAVSFVFMHDSIMNEYITDPGLGASTEWVVSFPTKHFYVNSELSGSTEPTAPFTSMWGEQAQLDDEYGACETITLDTLWNREEDVAGTEGGEDVPPVVSPAPPVEPPPGIASFALCYETSVIRFGDTDSAPSETEILGSTNFHNIDNMNVPDGLGGTKAFLSGWALLNMVDYPSDVNQDGEIDEAEAALKRSPLGGLLGLPVTGFAVESFQNGFLGDGADVLANYGGIFKHKATRTIGSDTAAN